MYDPNEVLRHIDANKPFVLLFCSGAMICNYIWFTLAAIKGFKDKVYPVPIATAMFWLVGDGTGVTRYNLYFNHYHHWYLELFWGSLIFTVLFEILYIYMILRFGRKELLPSWRGRDFNLMLLMGALAVAFSWRHILAALSDDLNIVYFNVANMVGPLAMAALLIKRRSTAGTSTAVWVVYTFMLMFWFYAQAMYFGPAFRTPFMLAFFAINILSSAALAAVVYRMSRLSRDAPARSDSARPGVVPAASTSIG
jgi:hypothetical protein